jgi:aminoglycoside phosphotransferase (APT) family kinase protein
MPKMHADELDIDEELVGRLLGDQFPEWAELPIRRVEPWGTVNAIFRLGDELAVRLPRQESATVDEREYTWPPLLAPDLPFEVPLTVARGEPGAGYPLRWTVVTWLHGETPIGSMLTADELALLVGSLQRIELPGGPEPGANRGKPLAARDVGVREALERVEAPGALDLWELARATPEWPKARVWLHGDLDARNVLVRDGRLTGVIDWGNVGVGDPAVDLMAAWKLLDLRERERFRGLLEVDDDTWLRAQGWAVSQALFALRYYTPETNLVLYREAKRWLAEVLG